jgi:hypothetical protein
MKWKLVWPRHSTVVAYVALFLALGGTAYAATGGPFILGHPNTASTPTALSNVGSGPALALGTHSASTPPLIVSNQTKVPNLDADMVDGLHAASFQRTLPAVLPWGPLTLINGWAGNCFGTGQAQIALAPEGVVHFRGGICSTGTSAVPFMLAAKYRPTHSEFIPVDECNATTGRLEIETNGTVLALADENRASVGDTPQCFTSLAGVSYTLPY